MAQLTRNLSTPDGPMDLLEVTPDEPNGRAVVVIQEAFGLNEHIGDVCRRLADEGYVAVAPALFHRTGSPVLGYGDFQKVMPHMKALSDDGILGDVDAAREHLHEMGFADERIGIVGFCLGGRVAFLVAARRSLGAAVTFYGGGIVSGRSDAMPSLVDGVAGMATPWLGFFGDRDKSISVDDVEDLRARLDGEATVPHEVVRYGSAGHGFFCDRRDSYDADAAADAWPRALAWFSTHLADA